ncbi:hypothetical protein [Microcoleus sp. B13-B6]
MAWFLYKPHPFRVGLVTYLLSFCRSTFGDRLKLVGAASASGPALEA